MSVLNYFIELVKISSESGNELNIAKKLKKDLEALGAKVQFDNSKTISNCSNLYAYFQGNSSKETILFSAHMDTVKPGKNIKPIVKNGIISSSSDTILGADDKAGIAEIIYAIKKLKENGIEHPPIEVVFTVLEEIGLNGSKNLDFKLIKSKSGFIFDTGDVSSIVNGAPFYNSFKIRFFGREAHAGVAPQKGVNAIKVGAMAISKYPTGRIDKDTTCNIAQIEGGLALNIVPNLVVIKGEIRSHSKTKLEKITKRIIDISNSIVDKIDGAKVEINITSEFVGYKTKTQSEVVQKAKKAIKKTGLKPKILLSGGGSDANNFAQRGMEVVVLGTGMKNAHTLNEFVKISNMERVIQNIYNIICEYSK